MDITSPLTGIPAEELLTTSGSARLVDVVPDTFRLWQRRGKVKAAFVTPTGIRLYRRADIEQLATTRDALLRSDASRRLDSNGQSR